MNTPPVPPPVVDDRELWDVPELARRLNVCARTLHDLAIPCVRIGRRKLFRPEDVRAWLAQQAR